MINLKEFVEIEENRSTIPAEEMVHICKRKNNMKRDFLFVNSFQGKHVPEDPIKIIQMFEELREQIHISSDEKIFVIGFAETATAIGQYLAQKLSANNCVVGYAQTTREKKREQKPMIEFKEEHSHSVEQVLYANDTELKEASMILFVDDEITTGKTILNVIKELEQIGIKKKYAIASFLNWQRTSIAAIDQTFYLIKGLIKDVYAKVNLSNIENTILSPRNKEKILFLGTEEYMFEPLMEAMKCQISKDYFKNQYHGNQTETMESCNILFHATTRSPIEISSEEKYPLHTRYKIPSPYDKNRTTYVYNLEQNYYRYVYIFIQAEVFETENESDIRNCTQPFIDTMKSIFQDLGVANVITLLCKHHEVTVLSSNESSIL